MLNRELIEEFSHLFSPDREDKSKSCMYWGLTVGDGWLPIIREFLECCAQSKREHPADWEGLYIDQVKQKWAELVIYTNKNNHDLNLFRRRAEARAKETCESCGAPKTQISTGGGIKNVRGQARLCDECA